MREDGDSSGAGLMITNEGYEFMLKDMHVQVNCSAGSWLSVVLYSEVFRAIKDFSS